MKRVTVSLVIALSSVIGAACGGSTDSGLFSSGDGGVADSKAPPSGDDQAQDSSTPVGDDDATSPVDASPPPTDAPITPTDAGKCLTDTTNGQMQFTVENSVSFSLGNTTWSQHGSGGADDMEAVYGEKCDGQASFTLPNHAGTFDLTKRSISTAALEIPVIEFQRVDGSTYVAGFDATQQCAPCGNGTITVTDWASGKVAGTFDLNARKVGSGQLRHFTGSFSFHH